MSRTLARGLAGLVRGAAAWMKPYRRAMTRALVSERLRQRVTLASGGGAPVFETPPPRSSAFVKTVMVEIVGAAGPGIRAALAASGFAEDAAFAAAGARRNMLFRRKEG